MEDKIKDSKIDTFMEKRFSRRNILKTAGIGGIGALIGATGLGGVLSATDVLAKSSEQKSINNKIDFYGKHQAGIVTPMQNNIYFASLEVKTTNRSELIDLFKEWTAATAKMTAGEMIGEESSNGYIPPIDTGEANGLNAANLTITFGVGPSLFNKNGQDRFGLKNKQPNELKDLPVFSLDALDEQWTGGDLCIQACSDDAQVCFHAVRNLIRIARGKAVIHWIQEGFQETKQANIKKETPRNLFGFKDGTVNPDIKDKAAFNDHVWLNSNANWLTNGTYLVVRKIQMHIEVWDRTTLNDQENTFGRHRHSGAPLGQKKEFDPLDLDKKDAQGNHYIPPTAHARVAHGKGKEQLYRRSYSYSNGMDMKTGNFDAGLLFISFQQSPSKQFVPIQNRLAKMDELNEYIVHKGSAVFACLPGITKGGFIGETLFN